MIARVVWALVTPAMRDARRATRAAAKTAVFFLKVLPMLPSRFLDRLTTPTAIDRVEFPTTDGGTGGDLYRPRSAGPHPGIVVCLGVVPFGYDHPQIPRLGAALARSGFAALIFRSPAMSDLRLEPEDVENVASAYQWLVGRPYVDETRSGLMGTCVGGSFAVMAAADARIRDRVAFVGAFAPYSSMWTLARQIASATRTPGGVPRRWEVDPLTRKVYVRSMTATLDPETAELLRNGLAGPDGALDPVALSEDAEAVRPLLTALSAEQADAALDRLPVAMRRRLDALSPVGYLDDVRAPLIVCGHDRDDLVIPVEESHRLRSALAKRSGVRYTEFAMFQHADPTKRRLPPLQLARELGKFYLYVYPIFHRVTVP